MAEPFLGEIRVFSFDFNPRGWGTCEGQLLPINQNQALFALLGTQFGGNGQTNFALPNLRDRVAIGFSSPHPIGQQGGASTHTVTTPELPAHHHAMKGSNARATIVSPDGGVFANPFIGTIGRTMYGDTPNTTAAPSAIKNTGGGQPHTNMQPVLSLLPCIALQGIFPPRN